MSDYEECPVVRVPFLDPGPGKAVICLYVDGKYATVPVSTAFMDQAPGQCGAIALDELMRTIDEMPDPDPPS